MKIGIISDTHGMYDSWRVVYEKYFFDCDFILHAGDILYHGPRNPILAEYNPAKLADDLNNIPNTILFAHGNCDSEVDNMILQHPIQTPYVLAYLNNMRIVLSHGHYFDDAEYIQKVAKQFKADVMIYGHIHLPVLEKVDNIIYLNPGSPSLSKLENKRGTAAIWQDDVIKIIYCDNGQTIKQVNLHE
ncbi:MAG: phosphodiesterase [Negativicutes bacterium]|jgi:hypothetical protein